MNTQDWALVVFTVLSQMSVGAFLVLGIVHFFIERKASLEEADRMADRVLAAVIVTLVLAMAASLFHLGNPLQAYKAVINFDTSWLSREILLGVLFTVTASVFVVMQWLKISDARVRNVIGIIAALIGLGFVYSQSRIYMLPAQPAWNTPITIITFFASTFLLGALAIGAALVANCAAIQRKNADCAASHNMLLRGAIRWIAVASIILVGIEVIVTPLYIAYLGTGPAASRASLEILISDLNLALILRMVFGFVGAGVLAAFLYQNAASKENKFLGMLAFGAFSLVFIAEILARYMFYATQVNIGV